MTPWLLKLKEKLAFEPKSGEWGLDDILAHVSSGDKYWSDRAIKHLVKEHCRRDLFADKLLAVVEAAASKHEDCRWRLDGCSTCEALKELRESVE